NRAVCSISRLEVELEPHEEQVTGELATTRGEDDRVAELGVVPAEVHLDVLRQVPVGADPHVLDAVGPLVGVGQAGGKDVVADVQVLVADERLPGPEAARAVLELDGVLRLDDADAAAGLAGDQVAALDVEALDGQLGPLLEVLGRGVGVEAAAPLADE